MQTYEVTLPDLSGGINVKDPEYAINDNQSPDLLNVWWKNKTLSKRLGLVSVTTLANVYRVSELFNSYYAVHAGTNLYKWNGTTATKISTGALENTVGTAGVFIPFNSYLYYLDGNKVWQINSSWTLAAITPYVPTVEISCTPTRTSTTDNEAYNLIGAGFKVTYNGDAANTAYSLPLTSLDATTVTCTVGGVAVVENTGFTVNRTAGTINFAAGSVPHGAPASGTNNVEITAYKTVSGSLDKIADCTIALPFGGESAGVYGGTRVFVMGNPTYPNHIWRSDLATGQGMTYFPDTSYDILGNGGAIKTAAKMSNCLVAFKETSIYAINYEFDGTDVYYPVREIHSTIGCDIPLSVQLINNSLVFGNSKTGINIIASINQNSEANVKPLSANIQPLLDTESTITAACSADYDRYYWFAVNGNVYLWDYDTTPYYNYADYDKAQRRLAWYKWDGVTASTMFSTTSYLYFTNSTGISRFQTAQNDNDSAYTAYYTTKAYDMGDPSKNKTFTFIYPIFSIDGHVKAKVMVVSEDSDNYEEEEYEILTFGWDRFRWDTFTWEVLRFAQAYRMRVKLKKSTHIQIKVESSEVNRGLGLTGLRIAYFPTGKVK